MNEEMTDVEFYMKEIQLKDRRQKIATLNSLKSKVLYNFSGKNTSGTWENVILTKKEGELILGTLLKIYEEDVERLEEELHGIDKSNVRRTIV